LPCAAQSAYQEDCVSPFHTLRELLADIVDMNPAAISESRYTVAFKDVYQIVIHGQVGITQRIRK
jgi:hypothetical protein